MTPDPSPTTAEFAATGSRGGAVINALLEQGAHVRAWLDAVECTPAS